MSNSLTRRLSSLSEPLIEWTIRICGWSAIFFVFAIFFFVFREAAPALFGQLDLTEFFTSVSWRPDSRIRPQFGILALLAGTASVTLLAMVIAVPAGLAAAVFVSEFCGPSLRETLKIVIELLAAIPSVVWGFIGYMVMNPIIIETTGAPIGINILNGGKTHPRADERAGHHVLEPAALGEAQVAALAHHARAHLAAVHAHAVVGAVAHVGVVLRVAPSRRCRCRRCRAGRPAR